MRNIRRETIIQNTDFFIIFFTVSDERDIIVSSLRTLAFTDYSQSIRTFCRIKMFRVILAVVVTILVTDVIAQGEFETFRLPNNTIPETYEISLRTWIHTGNSTFTGSVRIGIAAVESTDFITLHHNVQRLESVRVVSANEVPVNTGL